ncbi:MAG TPA: DUF5916 domain-containing protein, partial [Terriglobia bacterium]|nr:DUF5916 domain-containing protein [Terriglobia bacterium]
EPNEDQPASEQTEVRVLYDRENLYFGIYVRESQPGRWIISGLQKDFNRSSGDTVQILLDTFHDERNGYQFAINPAGAKWDAQVTNQGREVNDDWDALWTVQTRLVEDGWVGEIAIPFRTLKFPSAGVQTWGINFHRSVRRKNEDTYWSPLPRIYDVDRVSLAGTLEGLEDVRPGANLRVKPYLVGSMQRSPDGDRDWTGDLGIDLKYGITSALTWDFTYNTDFSQVEADDQQINLTRFSLFFPEKREFFLENSGIFQFSGGSETGPAATAGRTPPRDMIFFHSRRIGLSEGGAPIPIWGGTRLTGRAGPFELGLLNMQQREQGSLKATNFTVARLRHNVAGGSDLGVMFANKEEADSSHFNRVIGADANLRFGQALSAYSYLAKTFHPAASRGQLAGRAALHYFDNVWDLRSSYTVIQEDFINEMGFVPRRGIRKYSSIYGRAFRPQKYRSFLRRLYPHFSLDYLADPEGRMDTRNLEYHFVVDFQNGNFFETGLNRSLERLDDPFPIQRRRGIVIPAGTYRHDQFFVWFRNDASRRLYYSLRYEGGPYYDDGYKHTYTLNGTYRLNHHFNASAGYTHNNIRLPQGRFKTNLLNLNLAYAFSTAMFLNALVQYNNTAQEWNSNVRFNLIHRPLSDLFVVYNERRNSVSGDLIDRAVIAKVTYMLAR